MISQGDWTEFRWRKKKKEKFYFIFFSSRRLVKFAQGVPNVVALDFLFWGPKVFRRDGCDRISDDGITLDEIRHLAAIADQVHHPSDFPPSLLYRIENLNF